MPEEDKVVVLDADFLSSFLKIGKLSLIRDFFGVKKLHIPAAVFGEIAKTKLAKELLISDKKALDVAKMNQITVLNIPAFLFACKSTEFLNREELSQIIKDLKQKDYYEFSDEEKERLV